MVVHFIHNFSCRANSAGAEAPCACRGCPSVHLLDDVLFEPAGQQLQQPPIADVLFDSLCQQVVQDAVEVALQVSVHHVGVAGLEVSIDFP